MLDIQMKFQNCHCSQAPSEIYFLLSVSYVLLGISSPGSSDVLQYFWIIQFGCTIGAYLNGMQYFTLFPNQFGFLIG